MILISLKTGPVNAIAWSLDHIKVVFRLLLDFFTAVAPQSMFLQLEFERHHQ
jgi:hypothetical protein